MSHVPGWLARLLVAESTTSHCADKRARRTPGLEQAWPGNKQSTDLAGIAR